MSHISDILIAKGPQVHSVTPETSVFDAIARMVEHNIGALLVMEGSRPAGIFSERDHLRRVTLQNRDPRTTRISEVMTDRLVSVEADRTIEECMAIMTREHIRHLPVMKGGQVAGLISIGDLVKHVSQEQQVEIRHLTQYITGTL